jgi:hypothetical protein
MDCHHVLDDGREASAGDRGAVAVSWSRTVSWSTVTLSRCTSGVDARSVVTNVCSTWVIILQDTAQLRTPPSVTKRDDEPTSFPVPVGSGCRRVLEMQGEWGGDLICRFFGGLPSFTIGGLLI